MIRRIVQLLFFSVTLLLTSGAWATTYYIDWGNGADTNDGLTKATPWKRVPGMRGCSDNCAAYQTAHPSSTDTSTAGNQFILKGGVTWPLSTLSWEWKWGSGTGLEAGVNAIYIGAGDKTWYTGGAWSRPILDAQGGTPAISPNGSYLMLRAYGNYLIIDNIEFKGLAQLMNYDPIWPGMLGIGTSSYSGGEVKNCYFHGWSHGGTATNDGIQILASPGLNDGHDMNLRIHDNVFDGSDTTGDMAVAYRGSAGHFYNNYIGDVPNGVCCYSVGNVWGNTFYNIGVHRTKDCTLINGFTNFPSFDCNQHMQSYEAYGPGGTIVYNNLIQNSGGGGTILLYPNTTDVDYIFNNVVINDLNQTLQLSSNNLTSGNTAGFVVFNNTFQAPSNNSAILVNGPSGAVSVSFMTARNNHLIATNPSVNLGHSTTKIDTNEIEQTNAQATSAGYVSTSTYPYYPPAGGATVGTGMDLHTLAASIPSTTISDAATAALSDTTLGVEYDAVNHRIIGPKKTSVVRGTRWDVGAYERVAPAPPQNLRIVP